MWVYGMIEYNNKEYKNMYCDRVIIFNLLRSNVWVIIEGNNIIVEQQVHCDKFYNEMITKDEKESAEREKSAIEFWTKIHKRQLVENIPAREIIEKYTKGFDDTLIIRKEKMIVSKIEYARDKVEKEYADRRKSISGFVAGWENEIHKDYVARLLGINEFARGDETIRFNIPVVKDGEYYEPLGIGAEGKIVNSTIDIHIDSCGICQTNGGLVFEDYNVIRYFCHKHFELLLKKIPISEIIKIDNGEIINYKRLSNLLVRKLTPNKTNKR